SVIQVADVCATVNIPHVTVDENQLLLLEATVSGVGGANLDVSADLSGAGASGSVNLLGTEIPIEVTLEVPLDIVPTIVPTLPPVNIPVVPTLVPSLPGLGG
ncbi:MAG: hypothetical protein K8I60_12680, partial [Anaerolineae bacterium]|nr:hypothetical protein [Anaerolineae bacterium]